MNMMEENVTTEGNVSGDTVNIKSMLNRFKKKAVDILAENDAPKKETAEVVEEISIDMDEIKEELTGTIRTVMTEEKAEIKAALDGMGDTSVDFSGIERELAAVKKRLQAIQISTEENVHDNGNNITALHKSMAEQRDRISEIQQTINSVSKLSDSVFDLKNAQINMKKSIDAMDLAIKNLRKKLSVSTAILSVIGVLVIVLQIIALLS